MDLERPLRHPDTESAPLMSKRARWLVVIGFLLPGSAQVLAGDRRLGRFGLGATIFMIALLIVAGLGILLFRVGTLSLLTNGIVLLIVQVLIAAYAVMWLILGFDTLRLARLVNVGRGWRVPVAALSVLLTVLPVAGASYAAVAVGSARGAFSDIFGGGAPAVAPVDGRYNILLLGTDAGDDREGLRPDSISLVSVDAETGQSIIVGLPRDLVSAPFPEGSPMHQSFPSGFCVDAYCETDGKLNAVYTETETFLDGSALYPDAVSRGSSPGIEATKDAVSGATGLEVQFYVLIDMEGFSSLIDALGGVTVNVEQDVPLGGYEDPMTGEWVEGHAVIPAGEQKLDGAHALMFARVRHGLVNGDYDRMEHQRELQRAILAQMNPSNVLLRFQEIAGAGADLVRTDIPESMLGRFVDLAAKAKEHTPVNVEVAPPAVDPAFPDYAVVHRLVAEAVAAASPAEEEGE
ncbi:LCP family protein [Leucobacter sp. CSA1]|uniref:LCP family protein n=1 Tax=Leucobacter chromiisoli TaxID=2796471 RepID=A0A934UU00_9MICO|nr:LCP family protein [Leucobacter chromiisoli]MBK0417663.1 LCP family protein [Leucobacter chromiisoli]